jgi:flagellar hook-associated protein 1 FlgK
MGISSGFSIASSAISSFRVAAEVVAHNISNVDTEGYSRQRVDFIAQEPQKLSYGNVGNGVNISTIERMRNAYLDKQLYREQHDLGSWNMKGEAIDQMELYFNETSDAGISSLMSDMFEGWQSLASNPDDQATRVALVQKTQLFTGAMNDQVYKLSKLRQNLDDSVESKVSQINVLATSVAELNSRIVSAESDGHSANDLRDQRDKNLSDLSQLVPFESYEQSDGSVSITLEGRTMVYGSSAAQLETYANPNDPLYLHSIRWADTKVGFTPQNGEIGGLLYSRDTLVTDYIDKIDTLSESLVTQINRLHVNGRSLEPMTTAIGTVGVDDPAAALTTAASGLDILPTAGSFTFNTVNSTGVSTAHTITIGAATSLNDLVTQINGFDPNVTAAVNSQNRLTINAANGYSFNFSGDTTDTLVGLGINTFFSGYDASTIDVNQTLAEDAALIAAARSSSPGDNTNALAIAGLRAGLTMKNSTQTFEEYYSTQVVGAVGSDGNEAKRNLSNQTLVVEQIRNSIDETSSVSLDEEVTNMMQLQQAMTAAARYISILSQMMDEVVGIIK